MKITALGQLLLAMSCTTATSLIAQTPTPVPVLTWRYDLTHAGQNTSETALRPSNVNSTSFGKLFSLQVDGTLDSQPLYVPGIRMSDGAVHNLLIVATENDSIYAFDGDSNGGANANPIWQVSLLTASHGAGAGATSVPWGDTGSQDINPTIGITGTGTIDPGTNTLYVVAATKENGAYFSRLHAINIITGAEQAGSPVIIAATVAGSGNGSSGGELSFSPLWENQRTALNLYNGHVYFAYAAHGDNGPWHGWVFAYNATTLTQSAAVCLSPNGSGAGVWASGAGMPIDDDAPGGRLFLVTGNGDVTTYPPLGVSSDLGESVVAFSLANGGLTPTDAFTSYNYQTLNDNDQDLGSGGILMVPDQQGANPHILVQGGKEGRLAVLNRDDLGGLNSGGTANTNALQDITGITPQGQGFWNTPAYWNGNVYLWPDFGVPMLFRMNSGVMDTTPASQSTIASAFPSPSFSVSSSGMENGIAWAVRSDQYNTNGAAVLYAWNANDLTNTIYESDTDSSRNAAGPANKFAIPIVTNGKVYVAANGEVDVYGLFNDEPNAIAPVINPNGGTFSSSQSVSLSTTTLSAQVFYTLDGSTPTPASTPYAGPFTVGTDTTVKAIASESGYVQSGVSSATFTFTTTPAAFQLSSTAPPAVNPGGSTTSTITITPSGGFTGSVSVSCSVTGGPSGATGVPTCAATQPAAISGSGSVTSKLTINTSAASPIVLSRSVRPLAALGGVSVAALFFFCLPLPQRKWQKFLSFLVVAVLITAATGCTSSKTSTAINTGTTAGSYAITVTGTSGSVTATTTVGLTVN